jgi:hypothetical protein
MISAAATAAAAAAAAAPHCHGAAGLPIMTRIAAATVTVTDRSALRPSRTRNSVRVSLSEGRFGPFGARRVGLSESRDFVTVTVTRDRDRRRKPWRASGDTVTRPCRAAIGTATLPLSPSLRAA